MRHKRLRMAIQDTLRQNPDGLTAMQIIEKLPKKNARAVRDGRHISNLMRGMKNIKKRTTANFERRTWDNRNESHYKVNQYYYDDEGAEI